MINPNNNLPNTKKAVLFYNKQPLPFSDYAMYHIGADYIALYEKADNACVLCRILDENEYPLFTQAKHRLRSLANGRYYFPRRYGTKPDPVTVRLQAGTTTPVYFRNECIPSELNVIKTSDDNRIRSIYFSVTDSKGTQYPLLVTDKTGKAQIKNLPVYDRSDMPITYTVTELGFYVSEGVYSIPDRYAKPEPQSFTLLDDSADAVKSVMFHNSVVVGSVSLSKRSKSGSGLIGSQWALFTKDNQQVAFVQMGNGRYLQKDSGTIATLSTDSTGNIKISELPYGDYYFMEVQAPTGYMPYGEKLYFTVSDEEKEVSLTVTDNVVVGVFGITAIFG